DHVSSRWREASERTAIGADGVAGAPTADEKDEVIVVSACCDRGLRCRKVDRRRRGISQRRVARVFHDAYDAAVGRELIFSTSRVICGKRIAERLFAREKETRGCLVDDAGGAVAVLLVELSTCEHARANGSEVTVAHIVECDGMVLWVGDAMRIDLGGKAGKRRHPGVGGGLDAGTAAQKICHGTV